MFIVLVRKDKFYQPHSAIGHTIIRLGRHDRTCQRARKDHPRSLKEANEQKNVVHKLPFLNRLAQHALKLLAKFQSFSKVNKSKNTLLF